MISFDQHVGKETLNNFMVRRSARMPDRHSIFGSYLLELKSYMKWNWQLVYSLQ